MELAVHESGPADAPTLLFLHGVGLAGWMWEPQLARLADYHCLVPDLPGHGASAGVPFISIADCADRVLSVIRERAHRRVAHVIGLSLGAQVLLTLMAQYPGRVGRAVLSGVMARPMQGGALLRWGAHAYAPFRNLPIVVRANMQSLGIPAAYFRPFAAETRRLCGADLARIVAANLGFVLPAGLEAVAVPTLLLTGETENAVLHRSAEDLLGRLRNARSGVVQGLGHAWNMADPALFSDTLNAWVTGQPLPDRIEPLSAPRQIEVPEPPVFAAVADDDEEDWWEDSQA